MATYRIRITRGGLPVVGAEVTAAGERLFRTPDANGGGSASLGAYSDPIAVGLHIYKAGEIEMGMSPIRLEPGATRVIEV